MRETVINADIAKLENQYKLDESKFVNALKNLQIQLNEKEARYEEVNQDLNLYREGKIKEIGDITYDEDATGFTITNNSNEDSDNANEVCANVNEKNFKIKMTSNK